MPENEAVFCPECGDRAQEQPPRVWSVGTDQPAYSHLDGEPLCPVMTSHGYLPAEAVTAAPTE